MSLGMGEGSYQPRTNIEKISWRKFIKENTPLGEAERQGGGD